MTYCEHTYTALTKFYTKPYNLTVKLFTFALMFTVLWQQTKCG